MDAAGTEARAGFSTGVVYMKPRLRPGRLRSFLSSRIRPILFWLHLATGLAAGAVILVLSVSGVLLMYERQITEWADQRYASPLPPGGPHLPVEALLAAALAGRPGRPASVTLQADPTRPAAVSLGRERTVYLDPSTGVVLGEGSRGARRFFQWITGVHRWLGAEGESRALFRGITGACNVGFLLLILSGPLLWLPQRWTRRQVRNVAWFRRGLSGKARNFNWHNVIGLWLGVPLFFIVLTGVAMSYPSRSEGGPRHVRGGGDRGGEPAVRLDGLDALWARAERQVPGWRSLTMRLPPAADAPVAFTIARGGRARPDLRAQLTLDRRSGAVVRWETFASQSRGRQLRSWGRWVHTGEAGGFLGQTLAGLASAGAALLVWTGFALSWRRFLPRRQMPAAQAEPADPVITPQTFGRAPMKTNGKNRRKAAKKSGKRPSWLAYGAMAVSTLGSSLWASKPAWADRDQRDLIAQAMPAATGGPGRPGRAQTQETPVLRFDIPAGPLAAALDQYRRVTGFTLRIESDQIAHLASPGVSGLLTPLQALQELLAGTGVTFALADARTLTLAVQELAETLDVIDRPAPLASASPKYTAPLLDTPQSITVVPQSVIEERGATTLREVLRNVTGISLLAGEGGSMQGDNLAIRGFAAQNDIFVDGVRDFGSYTRDPFNVEQVEVAKGPGSLYIGHGSTGGAVNLVSKAPRLDAGRSVLLGGGADAYGRATVDINQPLPGVEGAALRINGMWTHADVPGRDAVESQRWGLAPSLAFGLGTATRTTVSYFHLDQDNVPDHGIPWVPATNVPLAAYANQPAPVDFGNFYGITSRDYEKTVTGIATAQVEHDVSTALTLRSLLRHGRSSRDAVTTSPRFLTTDSTVIRREFQSRDEEDAVVAQQNDLTFRFGTGAIGHVLIAGTELARETAENHARTAPAAPNTDLFHPDPGDPFTGPVTRTGARTESTAKTAALYAADTLKLGERWEINAGLRWDRFDVDFKSVAVDGVAAPFARTDQMVSWRAGLINKPRPNGSIYLAAGTSFNPSAEVNTGLTLTAATAGLEPEKSRSFEAGTKWDLAGSRLSLTSAVFQTEKVNAKTPGLNAGDPVTVLQGRQRIRGLELGATGKLTERWSAMLSYTYLKSKIIKSNNAVEVGNEFANTPDHSISLWTTWGLRSGFEIGAGGQYVGNRTNSTTTVRVAPAYTTFDAMVSYPLGNLLTLRLNVNNLTDERSIDRLSGGHFVPGPSRSVAMTTSLNF